MYPSKCDSRSGQFQWISFSKPRFLKSWSWFVCDAKIVVDDKMAKFLIGSGKIDTKLEVKGPTLTGCSKLGDLSACCKPVVFEDPLHWTCLSCSILEHCSHHQPHLFIIVITIAIVIEIVIINITLSLSHHHLACGKLYTVKPDTPRSR